MIYIQLDPPTSGVSEKCLVCGIEIPLEWLGRHIEMCLYKLTTMIRILKNGPNWRTPVCTSSVTLTIPVAVSPATLSINTVASTCAYTIATAMCCLLLTPLRIAT